MSARKILKKNLQGNKNIRFEEMVTLIHSYGFMLNRVSGMERYNLEMKDVDNNGLPY